MFLKCDNRFFINLWVSACYPHVIRLPLLQMRVKDYSIERTPTSHHRAISKPSPNLPAISNQHDLPDYPLLQMAKLTFVTPFSYMLFTALPPPPPTPMTLIKCSVLSWGILKFFPPRQRINSIKFFLHFGYGLQLLAFLGHASA